LRSPSLEGRPRAVLDELAERYGLRIVDADDEHGAAPLVGRFDLALCACGTACLEVALAGVPQVVAYRVDPIAWVIARRLVTSRFAALPNVLAGRGAVPELLQRDATPDAIAKAARRLAADPDRAAHAQNLARELRAILAPMRSASFGDRVAA